ncbi:MAG: sigma-54-dependent Fis family transcriptional regulator [Nitrospirae bacterium]|nr:sigma-54-dependent Fis family transcriptional regulator [Candidatus Manganitrophaceae bacterium]
MKILIIDDDPSNCELLSIHFQYQKYTVQTALTGREGLEKLKAFSPQIIFLDNRLPDLSGLSVLKEIRKIDENAFTIIMTAFIDMDTTIQAMKAGAFEYINKPINIDELGSVVGKIKGIITLRSQSPRPMFNEFSAPKIGIIIGKTAQMLQIFKTIAIASESNATVLIEGESGTGKELIARAIHYHGNYNTPFLGINCSALVETLLESELFGHEKGSFTGAIQKKEGKFEMAENGTLLLDEIGDMSIHLQAKLLRVLQEREFERVGGKEKIKANVRVIAATNKNLEELIKVGKFRKDLYYRLKVISIRVPPLRDRMQDIPHLVHFLINKISSNMHKHITGVSPKVMDVLMDYPWPGNIRELENVLTRAVVLTRGNVILEESLSLLPLTQPQSNGARNIIAPLSEIERQHIQHILNHTRGHKGKACQILGISRPALDRKIKKYQLSDPISRTSSVEF